MMAHFLILGFSLSRYIGSQSKAIAGSASLRTPEFRSPIPKAAPAYMALVAATTFYLGGPYLDL